MDAARITTIIVPKRRAQGPVPAARELVSDGPVDYIGRHARRPVTAVQNTIATHPRAHGFSILSRLARAEDLTSAAV